MGYVNGMYRFQDRPRHLGQGPHLPAVSRYARPWADFESQRPMAGSFKNPYRPASNLQQS